MNGEALEIFTRYQSLFENTLLFMVVLLGLGYGSKFLLRNIINAIEPTGRGYENKVPPRGIRILQACLHLAAWLFAFVVAAEVVNLTQARNFVVAIFTTVFLSLCGLAFLGFFCYSYSKTGNEFLLSLIGYWYLRYAKETRENQKEYHLGNDRTGTIQSRSLLHTTFILKDGSLETRSNASLMEHFFKIGWKA